MMLAAGTRLGAYEIVSPLGAGGMGEVWRARDEKLGREVALKVLPEAFADDPERMARFEREARVLASLNHPNIATLYGLETVERKADGKRETEDVRRADARKSSEPDGHSSVILREADGRPKDLGGGLPTRPDPSSSAARSPQDDSRAVTFLVMELVEGQGLDELIARGPIPVEEAIPIALQIAEALEAAHEAGIVHRDLKPANIRIRPDGTVKVLDFGLAKAWEAQPGDASLSLSPTVTRHATIEGVILGTAAYMSPEQARGKPVDKRSDIWAFGVVLWEILTGQKLFDGETVTDVLAAVVRKEIDLGELPTTAPAAVRRLAARCLERDPRNRLHHIADARLELATATQTTDAEPSPATAARGWSRWGIAAVASLALGCLLGAAAAWYLKPTPRRPSWELALAPPSELSGLRVFPKISPDGHKVAYIADNKLWVQDLDGLTPREVPRSEGTSALTWSPEGRFLAFAARSELLRTLPNGDSTLVTALTQAIATESGGLAWTADDEIVFSTGNSGLLTVPVAGGTPRSLLEPDKPHESDFHGPMALPGGRGIVFIVHRAVEGIDTVALLADGQRRTLYQKEHAWLQGLAWSDSGHLLVGSAGSNPGVWAIPVRPTDLTVTGEPFLVAANAGTPSISRDGTLVLSNAASIGQHQLTLVDRNGERLADVGEPVTHADHASFSPDGTRVAVCVFESKGQSIWLYDLERHSRSRLWSNVRCGGIVGGIAWSPDGQRIVFSDVEKGTIQARRSDGSDDEKVVAEGGQPSFSPDGRMIVFTRRSEDRGTDLWVMPLDGEETARPFLATPASEEQAHVSPDGHYVAYVSDETGRSEVQLRPFPEGSGQWQVSAVGGDLPRWSSDGKRLFYLQDNIIMEVEVGLGKTPVLSDPHPLVAATAHRLGPEHGYDVAPDGESFVTVSFGSGSGARGDLTLISPWPGTLNGS